MKDFLKVRLPFGKYKGRQLREVPLDYLTWLNTEFKGLERFDDLSWSVPKAVTALAEHEQSNVHLESMANMILNGDLCSEEAQDIIDGTDDPESIAHYLED